MADKVSCILLHGGKRQAPWQFDKDKYDGNAELAWEELTDHCNQHFSLSKIDELLRIEDESNLTKGLLIEDADDFVQECENAITDALHNNILAECMHYKQ